MLKWKEHEEISILVDRIYKVWGLSEEDIHDPRLKILAAEYNAGYEKMGDALMAMKEIIENEEVEECSECLDEDCEGCENCEGEE